MRPRRAARSTGWCRSLNEASILEQRRRRWPFVLAGLVVVSAVLAVFLLRSSPPAVQTEGVVFRYAFADGERRSYALEMDISFTPRAGTEASALEGSVKATMDISLVSKRPDGSNVIDLALEDVETTSGRTAAPLEEGRVRLTLAPDGRVLDAEGTGGLFSIAGLDPSTLLGASGGSAEGAGSQLLFPQLPDRQLEPGDKWSSTSSVPLPYGDDKAAVRVDGLLEGYEDTAAGRAARIKVKIDTPIANSVDISELAKGAEATTAPEGRIELEGNTVTESTSLLLPRTSELVRLDGTTTMSIAMKVVGANVEGVARDYAFDAKIEMKISRKD